MFKILHVEAAELIKKMTEDKLIKMNLDYTYLTSKTVKEGIEHTSKQNFDLIVTSYIIKDNGLSDFLNHINTSKLNRTTPIFILTSTPIDNEKKKILNLGVSDYILKENYLTELTKHIEIIRRKKESLKYLKSAKIAVLDDNSFDLQFIDLIFKNNGIEKFVDYFQNTEEFKKSTTKYDIYLIDAVLKDEYGPNLIVNIRRNNIDSLIYIVSSLNNPKTISSFYSLGADDFIPKPVQEDYFVQKITADLKFKVEIDKIKNNIPINCG